MASQIRSLNLSLTNGSLPGVVAVEGMNFTGRTSLLREFVGLDIDGQLSSLEANSRRAYIGPEIYNSLSGLALSIDEEIRLHTVKARTRLDHEKLLNVLGLAALRDRNPFELSGGEQALTALASALALAPERLSLDCCFEQVDAEMREQALSLLSLEAEHKRFVALADNRLREYSSDLPRFETSGQVGEAGSRPSPFLLPVTHPEHIPRSSAAPTIVLDGIRFAYRTHYAEVLREISITLEPANIYLLEGKNGSGKSTLAKILSGALRPQSGTLCKDGIPFEPFREPAKIFAYHFQNPDLQLFCSRIDTELAAGPRALGMGTQTTEDAVQLWAQAFGLSNSLACHPLDLPFVGRKRVALASTFAMVRPWLILDEPTLGQDEFTSEVLASVVQELKARGLGVIVISHSVDFRNRLGGRRLLLKGGTLVEQS